LSASSGADAGEHRQAIEKSSLGNVRGQSPVEQPPGLEGHCKEPKWFLRDWSGLTDDGARAETLVACHLLKAVEGWTDLGFGDYRLCYVRYKQKREVDFLVVRNRKPWFLVEVKTRDVNLSPALTHFQAQTQAACAFQVVMDLPFEPADCFLARRPVVVPARTFLSQLL